MSGANIQVYLNTKIYTAGWISSTEISVKYLQQTQI